jgi:hypothetical protein
VQLSLITRVRIVELATAGLPAEEVAAQLELSSTTVQRVLAGHFGRAARRSGNSYERCPGCGGMVNVWPCVKCCSRSKVEVVRCVE